MTKRILSMLLVLTMVLSIAVMGVSAATVWGGMNDYAEPTQGTGTAQDPFIIDTPQKLAWLSRMVEDATAAKAFLEEVKGETVAYEARKAFQGIYFKQTDDIDLADKAFMPIGSYMSATSANRRLFAGVYDGNGFAIKNAKVSMADHADSTNGYYKNGEAASFTPPTANLYNNENVPGHYDALFNLSAGAVVKNVNAVNVDTGNYDAEHTKTTAAAVIAGWSIEANIINCTSDADCSATATTMAAGMVVRTFGSKVTTVKNCTNGATITAPTACGIVGAMFYTTDVFTDCVNNGAINGTTFAGGFTCQTVKSGLVISNFTNNGVITGPTAAGVLPYVNVMTTVSNCTNNGTVNGSGITGGIVAEVAGTLLVADCVNSAEAVVTGNDYTGGIVGHVGAVEATVVNCANHGAVTSTKTNYHGRVGGIVGCANQPTVKTIENCVNTGAITSYGAAAGGIFGYVRGESTISGCLNSGAVETKVVNAGAGGIVGEMDATAPTTNEETGELNPDLSGRKTVSNSTNTGHVKGVTYAGGIVGIMAWGTVTMCVNEGDIETYTSDTATRVRHAVGGIVGSVTPCKEDASNFVTTNVISYCVNGEKASVSATTYGDAGMGGILGGTMGKSGQWTDGTTGVQFAYCFNLMTEMNYKTYGGNNNAAGSGIIGYACDRANNGTANTWDHVYSVDSAIKVTKNDGSAGADVAWNHGAIHGGLISNVVSAAQVTNCFGSADAFNAKVTNCNFKADVATIEAMSVYRDIIAANDAIAEGETIKFIGVQDSLVKADTYDVRFVAGLESKQFDAAGFMVKIVSAKGGSMAEAARIADTVVYTSLVGKDSTNGQTIVYNATDYDTTYFVALSIEGINLDTYGAITFEITPFTTKDGVDSLGHTYAVSYDGDGYFVSCARQ
ncbi:MAG: hypothetical protein IKJ35_07785 [Clostridia bacterium]|nr:hypothetical protein [Clostridia bacterium]